MSAKKIGVRGRMWPLIIPLFSASFLIACNKAQDVDEAQIKSAQELATKDLYDPLSAQFRDLRVRGDVVCGEINGKNRLGAYVGFRRFYALSKTKSASIDPTFDVAELQLARVECDAAIANDYVSVASAEATCKRVRDRLVDNLLQNVFNVGWAKNCEGRSIKLEGPAPDTRAKAVSKVDLPAESLVEDEEVWGASGEGVADPLVDADGNPIESEKSPDTNEYNNDGVAKSSDGQAEIEDPLAPGA